MRTAPLPPLQAADALIFTHETIKTIFANHGYQATMYPKPLGEIGPVIGSHIHLSISRKEHEDSFLAGMLEHWAALAAFYMPNYDSNLRVKGDPWVSWSLDNKSACIRTVKPGHWELRAVDGTSNPYLVLLGILMAGLLAVKAGKELTIKDPKKFILMQPNPEEAKELGLVDKMPKSLKQAIENLKGDTTLTEALGEEIIGKYLKIKTAEEEAFGKMLSLERRALSMNLF